MRNIFWKLKHPILGNLTFCIQLQEGPVRLGSSGLARERIETDLCVCICGIFFTINFQLFKPRIQIKTWQRIRAFAVKTYVDGGVDWKAAPGVSARQTYGPFECEWRRKIWGTRIDGTPLDSTKIWAGLYILTLWEYLEIHYFSLVSRINCLFSLAITFLGDFLTVGWTKQFEVVTF